MNSPLLQVQELSKTFKVERGGRQHKISAVDRVSFSVNRGEIFGLVGESGSGKTTVARLLTRLASSDSGRAIFDGIDLFALSSRDMRRMRRRIQIIFQDSAGALDPHLPIGRAIAQAIRLYRIRPVERIVDRVEELLRLVGLPGDFAGRFPHEMSGGQRQRAAIARVLAVEPSLIICDEPLTSLDLSTQAQIINLLADLHEQLGVGYLFISHDLAPIRHLATTLGVLHAGRLVELGPTAVVLSTPRHPYTRDLIGAAGDLAGMHEVAGGPRNIEIETHRTSVGCGFVLDCPLVADICRINRPGDAFYGDGTHQAACFRASEVASLPLSSPAGQFESSAYRARSQILRIALENEK